MKKTEVIQNLKCGGCANTITNALNSLPGVKNTQVDIEGNAVTFEYEQEDQVEAVEHKLSQLGYPIDSDPNSLLKQAKSYFSCMIGRVSDSKEEKEEV
jgi:copper chaperone CopZ